MSDIPEMCQASLFQLLSNLQAHYQHLIDQAECTTISNESI